MNHALVLALVALATAILVLAGRMLARSRLRRLRDHGADRLWSALGTTSDGRATVVAFSTPSCAACRTAQKPALAALQERAPDRIRVIHVDAAAQPELARAFGVL